MDTRKPKDTAAISFCGLTRRYGEITALKDLTLEVGRGEVVGFLGLNGAGKTTAIRLLLDLLRPTSGEAFIFGHNCWTEGLAARAHVGYLPGELGVYKDLTGAEILEFLAGLRSANSTAGAGNLRRTRAELMERFGLPERDLRRRFREYSTGMKRKLGLIQAFESEPPLLILDEPTEGLDPLMQEVFYALVKEAKNKGGTVFMSSHVLSEVERVCERIALLRKGELVLLTRMEEMRTLTARQVRVSFSKMVEPPPAWPEKVRLLEASQTEWTVQVAGELAPLLGLLNGMPVKDLHVHEPRLEDVVLRYYREGAR